MAQLAIKAHPTRTKEVIEILEMLGGKNRYHFKGDEDEWFVLNGNIQRTDRLFAEKGFTLEEFLEKYPYKVGDKVRNIIHNENQTITDLVWGEDEVLYQTSNNEYVYVNYLQPYKEETMEDKDIIKPTAEINLNHPCFDGRNEIELIIPEGWAFKQRDGKMFGVRKQYPKTYEECCKVLGYEPDEDEINCYQGQLIESFVKLLICRDAYWKIAGEEMGLDKPWKPDWKSLDKKYNVY